MALAMGLPPYLDAQPAGEADQQPESAPLQLIAAKRPSASNRTVRMFDFEERSFNVEPVPQYWVRAQQTPKRSRAGFPPWNEARFDDSYAASGKWSVMLPSSGGSTALRLVSGVIPVLPGAEYAVIAKVRTHGAEHTRVRLVARLVDDLHQPIPGAVAATAPTRSEGKWKDIHLDIAADQANTAWLQIELQLLQPAQLQRNLDPFGEDVALDAAAATNTPAPSKTGAPLNPVMVQRSQPQDFHAVAWFDDIHVLLAPRVSLTTSSPINIIELPDEPIVKALVRDVAGETLRGRLTLINIDGDVLDQQDVQFVPGGRAIPWRPHVGAFGWKRATLHLETVGGQSLSGISTDFIWTPARGGLSSIDAQRFELLLAETPEEEQLQEVALVKASGSGAVHVPLWTENLAISELRTRVEKLQPMLDAFLESATMLTLALDPMPTELAQRLRLSPESPVLLLRHKTSDWDGYFRDAVARLGQRITRWRLGKAFSAQAWRFGGELKRKIADLQSAIEKLAPSARLITPWSAAFSPVDLKDIDASMLMSVPASFTPESVANIASQLSSDPESSLLIEPLHGNPGADRASAVDLVKRIVWAWRERNARVALQQPWSWSRVGKRMFAQPTALFAAWRQTVERLSERRFVADLPAPAGATVMLFDGPAGPMVAAWAKQPNLVGVDLPIYVGEEAVRAMDVFGNPVTVAVDAGRLVFSLREAPTFIMGVDAPLLALQSTFRVEPAFLPSLATRHELVASLINPYPRSLSGTLRIDTPEGWEIRPRVLHFTIGPGEKAEIPFDATFGVSEPAGVRDIWTSAIVRVGSSEKHLRLRAFLELGLHNVVLTHVVSPTPTKQDGRPGDVLVTLLVTNTGATPLTLEGFAQAPGFPRQQAPLSDVPPGETGVVRFLFREGADKLSQRSIRIGVMETDGLARLNAIAVVP